MASTSEPQCKRHTGLYAAGIATAALGGAYLVKRALRQTKTYPGPYVPGTLPEDAYDVVIVGAGPSGAVAAYYLAKGGARVALLEKESFPRDKICGDACVTPALRIMDDMGVTEELVAHDEIKFADNGGFVSPAGIAYIGNSQHRLGTAAAAAVKRIILDERMARAAARAGAELIENYEVADVPTFDAESGLWTVASTSGDKPAIKGRALVAADGSHSKLAISLGLVEGAPLGVSSRAFVEGHTHNAAFDGVCFYAPWSLPGYSAVFKHAKDELGFCYYLIPCGPNAAGGQLGSVTAEDLPRLHKEALERDPFISRAMGPKAKIGRMRASVLRVGSQGVKATVAEHLLVVGDAAGHVDPLTGEGIHNAMVGGKMAAEVLLECVAKGDFSARSLRLYDLKWKSDFGSDFVLSIRASELIWRFPILLDAAAAEMQRTGDVMMSRWAEVMTNMRKKTYFLRPDVAAVLGVSLVKEIWRQKVRGEPSKYVLLPAKEGDEDEQA